MDLSIVCVCTGNAARSVIAGAAFADRLPDARVATCGTHVVEGMPLSWRTQSGINAVGLHVRGHRSRQARGDELEAADLIVGLAPDHVAWVRRNHPGAASRTATLRRLCRDLPGTQGSWETRLAALDLAAVTLESWEEVVDPAGGEEEDYIRCAQDVVALVDVLAVELGAA
jgi:protein-tyrosine-phosphatase